MYRALHQEVVIQVFLTVLKKSFLVCCCRDFKATCVGITTLRVWLQWQKHKTSTSEATCDPTRWKNRSDYLKWLLNWSSSNPNRTLPLIRYCCCLIGLYYICLRRLLDNKKKWKRQFCLLSFGKRVRELLAQLASYASYCPRALYRHNEISVIFIPELHRR